MGGVSEERFPLEVMLRAMREVDAVPQRTHDPRVLTRRKVLQ
jgi:hypothetical protein